MNDQQEPTAAHSAVLAAAAGRADAGRMLMKSSWLPRLRVVLVVSAASIALGGCYGDPYQNPGFWHVSGAERENLAQQVADKSDLIRGQGAATSNGIAGAAAVDLALGGAKGDAAGLQAPPKALSFSSASGS